MLTASPKWRNLTSLQVYPQRFNDLCEHGVCRVSLYFEIEGADNRCSGIMNDPELFPHPDKFEPERFIETTNPRLLDFDLPFGFGRRICPGMHLARNSIFINIARLLWGFHILPAFDEKGAPIIPDSMHYTDGFNSKPVSFECRFIPRSEKIVDCIKSEFITASSRLQTSTW